MKTTYLPSKTFCTPCAQGSWGQESMCLPCKEAKMLTPNGKGAFRLKCGWLEHLFFSGEPSRYLLNSLLEQPHMAIRLFSTFYLALYKHFPLCPQTAAHLCLPPCLLDSPPQAQAGGVPCKQLVLWGSMFLKPASSFRRSFTRLALTSMSYSGAATEKCCCSWKTLGELCCKWCVNPWPQVLKAIANPIEPVAARRLLYSPNDKVLSAPRLYFVNNLLFSPIHQTSFGLVYLVNLLFVNCHGALLFMDQKRHKANICSLHPHKSVWRKILPCTYPLERHKFWQEKYFQGSSLSIYIFFYSVLRAILSN